MSLENNKEKREQAESVQKEQKQSYIREVFKLIDEIPVGKIFSLALMYSFSVFIIPYFIYYRFFPISQSINSIPIKLISLMFVSAISFIAIIMFLILAWAIYIFFRQVEERKWVLKCIFIIMFLGGILIVSIVFGEDFMGVILIILSMSALFWILVYFYLHRQYIIAILIAFLLTPLPFLIHNNDSYIKFLEIAYSYIGITSNKNVVCVNKNYSFAIPCCYKQIDINEDLSVIIHKNTNEQYICYENLKIIWNGDNNIWIASNQNKNNKHQPIISIPKKYLLNNDIINYGYKTTPKIKQIQKSQIQTQGDGTQNINPQSKKTNTEKLNYKE